MARQKKEVRAKEPVKIRFKQLKNGNKSVYLDIYKDGRRRVEYLKMYIIPDNAPNAKVLNENTMQAARVVQARRIMEITDSRAGLARRGTSKMTIGSYLVALMEKKGGKKSRTGVKMGILAKHLQGWKMDGARLADIDKAFCLRFLENVKRRSWAESTKVMYMEKLIYALNEAVRADLIPLNPMDKVNKAERIKKPESTRIYLSVDEVRSLISTQCKSDKVKRAFLFACFCGLRRGDIERLKWGDIVETADGRREIHITMQKTQKQLILPLNDEAVKWLPERTYQPDMMPVFGRLWSADVIYMKQWIEAAGITKPVCFHTSRHTFATLLLTYGADLYAVSKLLGHSNITVTQVYAKLIDKKKAEAANVLNGVF